MEGTSERKTGVRVTGSVTSFDAGKGYGFVAREGGKEIFADQKEIQGDGLCVLAIGDRVRYEVIAGPEGPHVSWVRAF